MSASNEPKAFEPIDLKQLAEILIKHHGVHEGFFEAAPEITFGVGGVNFPEGVFPGVVSGIKAVRLQASTSDSPWAVDAAVCNPAPASKRKTTGTKKAKSE